MRLSRRSVLIAAGSLLVAGTVHARSSKRDEFEVTERELYLPGLDPAHDGVTLAHLTDLHVGASTPDGRIIAAVRAVNARRPELVLLTGDFVTASRRPIRRLGWLLAGIAAPTVAVLGNHDHWVDAPAIRRDLEKLGYAVLQNAWTEVRLRAAPFRVVGIDDGRTGRDDVEASFRGLPRDGSRLVLAHTPPTAEKLPEGQGLLCLSGHTHGGQVQIPRVTDAVSRCVGQRYVRGLYEVRGNQLFVNRGLGYGLGGPAVRVGAPPELAFVTLRRA